LIEPLTADFRIPFTNGERSRYLTLRVMSRVRPGPLGNGVLARRAATSLAACVPALLVAIGCSTSVVTPIATERAPTEPSSGSPILTRQSSYPFWLDVADIDGPTVTIEINGRIVATVRCMLTVPFGPMFTPGPGLPLPWDVRVLRSSGQVMLSFHELGAGKPDAIMIRGEEAGVLLSENASGGPAPLPSATCSP
jgi:hypothetical protein